MDLIRFIINIVINSILILSSGKNPFFVQPCVTVIDPRVTNDSISNQIDTRLYKNLSLFFFFVIFLTKGNEMAAIQAADAAGRGSFRWMLLALSLTISVLNLYWNG